ncbi:uncharacterized protein LOC113332874 [Papaver somniferum]|uniref:uncharacterized protein LOC113332874 n=1 Tax=Papaver somniferum TaxID=3469 RepID=UPI000E704F6F|nr:uncharacterized protein LOC113332874 [Papaver somniferum]
MAGELEDPPELLRSEDPNRWEVFVDGSCNSEGSGIGMVITTPTGRRIVYNVRLKFTTTNNITEYEAVIHALRVIIALGITDVRLTSDSQLVVRQIDGTYQASDPCLQRYLQLVKHYIEQIQNITFLHLNRINNRYAYALAFIASMKIYPEAINFRIERVLLPSIPIEGNMDILVVDSVAQEESLPEDDWRTPIIKYLANGHLPSDQLIAHKIISRSGNYQLRDGVLYKQSYLGPLLICLSFAEGQSILKEIHYGYAGKHSGGRSLAHKERLQGYFWPRMNEDSKQIAKTCIECQKFGKRRHAPSMDLKSVLSPWPFAKWGVDIVGPLRADAIIFDNGAQLRGKNIDFLFKCFKIRKNKSTPIYRESNGQVEATNKTIADMLKKKLDGYRASWCEQLHNVLWAYRTTRREATGMSPFALTYGTEAIIPTEAMLPITKTGAWEKNLTSDMILSKLDDLEENREISLQTIENYHRRLAREYNKRVHQRQFIPGDNVWHEIPPYQRESGKFAPIWEGPLTVLAKVGNGAYRLLKSDGE